MSDLLQKFVTDGYAVMEGFLTNEEVDALKQESEKLIESMPEKSQRSTFSSAESTQNKNKYFLESADKISYFYETGAIGSDGELLVPENKALNKIGHALHELNDVFRAITLDVRVKETCFQLGFQDPVIPQSMYIFKNPGIGSVVIPHQDASYLYTEPTKIIGFWIALDDATVENGCLRFIKGSHKSGVHRRYLRNPDESSEDFLIYDKPAPFYQMSSFIPVPVPKGSCILIDGQVVHFSEANRSGKSRHAYTFHVIENQNTKYSKENWLQYPEDKSFMQLYKN
ncbi:phytanoyl-CoA dioxygenase domain-containing protein 1-like [Onthophagus taurus]|uniref:phytanoyl-CoA dioxygenase domain-containing protein 1-like n=1 Tax=Onthophagus taurus TaxID=166361 RepID=UPI000C20FC06|nr:phytanoyl-CoA dioxygenase domain-containing protein 1-like [Onthophagus taurus]